jgi:glycosyltransferase involved in cell wall biosynthesis
MSPAPLRIALLSYRGHPFVGGQGVYVRQLSRALTDLGHSVTVFGGQPYPELDSRVELVRLPSLDLYRDVDPFRVINPRELRSAVDAAEYALMCTGYFAEPLTFSLRALRELRLRAGDFDLVHDNQCLGYGLLRLQQAGLPLLTSFHHPIAVDRDLDLAQAPTLRRRLSLRRWYSFTSMQHRVARRVGRIITGSTVARDDIVKTCGVDPSRVEVVAYGVDTGAFEPRPGVEKIPGRLITTASMDVPLKGLVHLLEALAKVRTEREAELVVVGKRRSDSRAQETITRLGLQGAVSFVSGVDEDRLVDLYAQSDVAVVPSLYEGFSLPAAEAMSCGVPVVATTGGALPEVVGTDDETALLVPPGDSGALAVAIKRLLDDPGLRRRIGDAGRSRVLQRFTWTACAGRTVDVYREVIAAA